MVRVSSAFAMAIAAGLLSLPAFAQTVDLTVYEYSTTSCDVGSQYGYQTFDAANECINLNGVAAVIIVGSSSEANYCYLRLYGNTNCQGNYDNLGPIPAGQSSCIASDDPDTGAFRNADSAMVVC